MASIAATSCKTSSSSPNASTGSSPGRYSAQQLELTAQNVDLVLEDVRPYLIADGGNVDDVSVEDGIISLKLQGAQFFDYFPTNKLPIIQVNSDFAAIIFDLMTGACGSCPSSTTTMKMGIERVLKEKFGDAVKDIRQVNDDEEKETTVEAVISHLDKRRPAIKNYGGSVEVLSIKGGECAVKYIGPESIGSGIKAAIERFPDITNIHLTG
ncbi:hypothetical protein CRYUN_Cryun20dG0052300 [Craigia yunnanensis]